MSGRGGLTHTGRRVLGAGGGAESLYSSTPPGGSALLPTVALTACGTIRLWDDCGVGGMVLTLIAH